MLHDVAVFLIAAVIAVPLSRMLGMGAIIGYLVAGIAIGPWGLEIVTDVHSILAFSEFGVVLLLFLIGLELQPSRLWRLREQVFGVGGAQMVLTGMALGGIGLALDLPWHTAVVVGFGLAMSSTAFVLQILAERKELLTYQGRGAFAVLLFQDLSVIPFLAIIPLLASNDATPFTWKPVFTAVAVIVMLVLAGRFALRPALRLLARADVPEIFSAAALLVVVGTSLLMEAVGLAMSLGAFMAGMLLADSEFRHELQAAIEPFKGMLLGLFFIAVGMGVNLDLLTQQPLQLFAGAAALMAVKAGIVFAIAQAMKQEMQVSRALAALLCQGGEFAFVIFSLAFGAGLMEEALQQQLVLVVSLSMLFTPPLYAFVARMAPPVPEPQYDTIDAGDAKVILAGFGPFGQIIARLLRVKKIPFTVLEKSPDQVDFVRRFGNKIYYGDAARLDLLRSARADRAKVFVITIPDVETSLRIAETVRRHFPHLRIYAVAKDRNHALRLMDLGVHDGIRRAYLSSLELGRRLLIELGIDAAQAEKDIATFRKHDEATLMKQQAVYRDEQQMIQTAQDAATELEQLFETDRPDRHD